MKTEKSTRLTPTILTVRNDREVDVKQDYKAISIIEKLIQVIESEELECESVDQLLMEAEEYIRGIRGPIFQEKTELINWQSREYRTRNLHNFYGDNSGRTCNAVTKRHAARIFGCDIGSVLFLFTVDHRNKIISHNHNRENVAKIKMIRKEVT